MGRALKIAVEAKQTVALDDLNYFQDNIKKLSKQRYEELKTLLADLDISFALHVWENEGKFWLIDGHQRVFTMRQMREAEGWEIPEIPVAIVHAPSFEIAKQKVLAGISVAGEIDAKKLEEYLHNYDIPVDGVFGMVNLPNFDKPKFMTSFLDLAEETEANVLSSKPPPQTDMRVSSTQVKQVQLFFESESHAEFLQLVGKLSEIYSTENVTDTVLSALREASSSH